MGGNSLSRDIQTPLSPATSISLFSNAVVFRELDNLGDQIMNDKNECRMIQ